MEDHETLSATSSFEENEVKSSLNPFRLSTRCSTSSLQGNSLNNSPKNLCKGSFIFPQRTFKGKRVANIEEGATTNRKVSNFHKAYLEPGLWPDKAPIDQYELQAKYKTLRKKYQHKSELLKKSVLPMVPPCKNCLTLEKKHKSTEFALKKAVELSTFLLREIKKIKEN